MNLLNGARKEELYADKSEVDRLSTTIHSEVMPILHRMEYMQEHVIEEMSSIKKDVSVIKDRNAQQDMILKIVKKIPYLIFIVSGFTLMVSNKNFSFTDWFMKEAKQVVHYEV